MPGVLFCQETLQAIQRKRRQEAPQRQQVDGCSPEGTGVVICVVNACRPLLSGKPALRPGRAQHEPLSKRCAIYVSSALRLLRSTHPNLVLASVRSKHMQMQDWRCCRLIGLLEWLIHECSQIVARGQLVVGGLRRRWNSFRHRRASPGCPWMELCQLDIPRLGEGGGAIQSVN